MVRTTIISLAKNYSASTTTMVLATPCWEKCLPNCRSEQSACNARNVRFSLRKRTCAVQLGMSAMGQKRTFTQYDSRSKCPAASRLHDPPPPEVGRQYY